MRYIVQLYELQFQLFWLSLIPRVPELVYVILSLYLFPITVIIYFRKEEAVQCLLMGRLLLLGGPRGWGVAVTFWGISQYCCNDKPFSALWPTEPTPQTHSSRVIPDGGGLERRRRQSVITTISGFSHISSVGQLKPATWWGCEHGFRLSA